MSNGIVLINMDAAGQYTSTDPYLRLAPQAHRCHKPGQGSTMHVEKEESPCPECSCNPRPGKRRVLSEFYRQRPEMAPPLPRLNKRTTERIRNLSTVAVAARTIADSVMSRSSWFDTCFDDIVAKGRISLDFAAIPNPKPRLKARAGSLKFSKVGLLSSGVLVFSCLRLFGPAVEVPFYGFILSTPRNPTPLNASTPKLRKALALKPQTLKASRLKAPGRSE